MEEITHLTNPEHNLLGCILVDDKCLSIVDPDLREEDFGDVECRQMYRAVLALKAKNIHPDPVTMQRWSQEQGVTLSNEKILHYMNLTPSAARADEYSRMVHENGIRRAIQAVGAGMASDSATPLSALIQKNLTALNNISTHVKNNDLIHGTDVRYEPPKWLIEPYFQRGKGTLVQADPGTGKTAFMCAVTAAVTTGRGFLGLKVQTPGDVLILSTEDDLGVLQGRIVASGGDMRRVHFMGRTASYTLLSPEIEQNVKKVHARLLIFDPFQAFLGSKVDLFRANETRPILAQLFEMCARNDCACVIIAHLSKMTQGKSAVNQSLGSVDIPGAMRSILHIARNPNMEGELLACHIKSSNAAAGKTIAYSIGEKGGVVFHGFSDLKLEDLSRTQEPRTPYEQEPLVGVLNELITKKPQGSFWSYEELRDTAVRQLGFSPFHSSKDMNKRLTAAGFARELLERDGIVLTAPAHCGSKRGIRLQKYTSPQNFQTELPAVRSSAG